MKSAIYAICLLCAVAVSAADITLAWDPCVSNEDGTPVVDLGGYNIHYSPLVVAYRESNSVLCWSMISNVTWSKVFTTNTQVTLTLPSTVYTFYVTGVAGLGEQSAPSSNITKRVGRISTLKLFRAK